MENVGNVAEFTRIFSELLSSLGETGICHVPLIYIEKTLSEFNNMAGGKITPKRFDAVASWAFTQDRYRRSVFLDPSPHWAFVKHWNQMAADYERAENRPPVYQPHRIETLTESEKKAARKWYADQGAKGGGYERFEAYEPSQEKRKAIAWDGSEEQRITRQNMARQKAEGFQPDPNLKGG